MLRFTSLYVGAALLAAAVCPPALADGASAGSAVFMQCMACHTADASNATGPGLGGVLGRVSGTHAGFRYSRAMKNAKLTWDAKNLDAFIANPQQVVPGNVMPFSGIASAADRTALIAYLATLK